MSRENSKISDVYSLFFHAGEVAEIRALGLRGKGPWRNFAAGAGIVSGYFDNSEDFGKAAQALDKAGASGVYFTVNPCDPALIARAANRLVASPPRTTTDAEIVCLRWLLVDLDPLRPAGISATNEELEAALGLAREVAGWLENKLGFPQGLRACSGNGYHLCYRLPDLPNDDGHVRMIKRAIGAIANKFSSQKVEVDQGVFNPARIWKVYGTTARKGDSTPTRPHRKSFLLKNNPQKLGEVPICPQIRKTRSKN